MDRCADNFLEEYVGFFWNLSIFFRVFLHSLFLSVVQLNNLEHSVVRRNPSALWLVYTKEAYRNWRKLCVVEHVKHVHVLPKHDLKIISTILVSGFHS